MTTTCSDCGYQWTSTRACHCTACHRTFGGEFAFSMHQGATEGCDDPAEIKTQDGRNRLVVNAKGWWCQPGPREGSFADSTRSESTLVVGP